jgi:AcrR family transcriptional regulator
MPDSPRSEPSEKRADKRAAILEAALHLFVERGFHGTAVPLVAERARVGAGTIYRYFASKEALVNELYREWKQKLRAHLLDDFAVTGDAREQFRRVWNKMADFVERWPTAYAFLEIHHHSAYLDPQSRAIETELWNFAIAFIRIAQARGQIRPETPEVMWSLVQGAFIGMVRFSREGRYVLDAAAVAAAEEACWRIVGPTPST